MSTYHPEFLSAPESLRQLGIDFLTRVDTSANDKPSLPTQDSEDPDSGGDSKSGPSYGTIMFRKPRAVELDQGYAPSDYFLTSPSAVESPFSHSTPTERGLMTQDKPQDAIKMAESVDEPVLYGDVNGIMDAISRGLSGIAQPVASNVRRQWDGLSDENKAKLGVSAAAIGAVLGSRALGKYASSKAGQTFMITRALRSGGGSAIIPSAVDVSVLAQGGADNVRDAYAEALDAAGADERFPAATAATAMGAIGAKEWLASDHTPVAQIPVDFFKTAYALGQTYQNEAAQPEYVYQFMTGAPLTTTLALKYLKAPQCFLDRQGCMYRTAVPYSAPLFFAGGALWDKIKNGVKKIGGKIIDGARSLLNSGVGNILTSIIPGGGIVKTVVNAAGKVKDWLGGSKSDSQASDAPATQPAESPGTEQVVAVGASQPAANAVAQAVEAQKAQNEAERKERVDNAKALITQAGLTPLDELAASREVEAVLPASWRTSPDGGSMGGSLAERVTAVTQAVSSGDPLNGFAPLAAIAAKPALAFLLRTAAEIGVWYGLDKAMGSLSQTVSDQRKAGADLPSATSGDGVAPLAQQLLNDWLSRSAAAQAVSAPGSGAPLSAVAKLIGKAKPVASAAWKGAKNLASKAGSWLMSAFKKRPGLTIAGSAGAMFVASSMINRDAAQREDIVKACDETLSQLGAGGLSAVTDPIRMFIKEHWATLLDDPGSLSPADQAYWQACVQYCYIMLLAYDANDWSLRQRELVQRCQKAGDQLKGADPEAYSVLSGVLGQNMVSATGVDPDAMEKLKLQTGELDETTSPTSDAASAADKEAEAADLLKRLGLSGATAGLVAGSMPPAEMGAAAVGPIAQPGALSADEDGGGQDVDAQEEDKELTSLAPSQVSAVEQASAMMALPSTSAGDEQRTRLKASQVLTTAGISAGAAALILAMIDRKRAEVVSPTGAPPGRNFWSSTVNDPRSAGRLVALPY